MLRTTPVGLKVGLSFHTKGTMRGGIPRIHYGWMRPGSFTRRRFEKMRNPFVDLETGSSLYYQSNREPIAAMAHEADSYGLKGMDNATDLYNEYKIVPDLYPEGFQWKHKLNTEYNQWRSNTWVTPDLVPVEHRGRLLCNFQLHVSGYEMRIAKFGPKDHRQWISCLLYVGTGKGIAGLGKSIAPSTAEAKQEAVRNAFQNLQGFDLEQDGPMYPVRVNVNGCRVMIYPAKKLVCNFPIADIMCAFGLQAVGVKVNTTAVHKPRAPTHVCTSLFEALRVYKSVSEVAASRGKVPHSLIYNIYPYLEEVRRRKGMMAMHPEGKDGLTMPDRVVDNRMPDHLKRGYYNDSQWKDFFAGDSKALSEPRMGLRGDQLRALAPPARRSGRRTLADVLSKMGRSIEDLGRTPVANAGLDRPLPTHMKQTFALH